MRKSVKRKEFSKVVSGIEVASKGLQDTELGSVYGRWETAESDRRIEDGPAPLCFCNDMIGHGLGGRGGKRYDSMEVSGWVSV